MLVQAGLQLPLTAFHMQLASESQDAESVYLYLQVTVQYWELVAVLV
jgi:hypothetical protein